MATTYANIQTDVLRRMGLVNDADALAYVKRAINEVDRDIWWAYPWHDRRKTAFVNTVAPYTTGTVTLTNGSAAVVGVGTTFTASMVGRKIALSYSDPYYIISAVADATHLTLARAYLESTAAATTYTIYNDILILTAMNVLIAHDILPFVEGYDYPLVDATSQSANNMGHMPRSKGVPSQFVMIEDGTSAGMTRIQVWPVPDDVYAIRYTYLKDLTEMSADASTSSNPEQRRDLITIGATAKGLHYNDDTQAALQYEALFERRLQQAIAREKRLHPRSVVLRPFTQPSIRPARSGKFTWRV